VINQEMRKLTKMILSEVGVGDLKIRPRGDNRCESANSLAGFICPENPCCANNQPSGYQVSVCLGISVARWWGGPIK